MLTTDWEKVVGAIRAGNLQDITPEEWKQVAEKLDTFIVKKKGRPRNPENPRYVFDENSLCREIDRMNSDMRVLDTYDKLVGTGETKTQVKSLVGKELGKSFKSVEKILTNYRGERK